MRRYGVIALLATALGSALGAALATSPAAVADPINPIDVWPYGGAQLPGFFDVTSQTNFEQDFLGSQADYNYLHYSAFEGPGDPWYSVHDSTFNIPSILSNDYDQVTALLDPTASYPTVGTTADQFEAFLLQSPVGVVPLITNDYLNDPVLGFADEFKLISSAITNLYVSDSAGIQDVLSLFGQSFTLFEIPAADAAAAAASDLGDGSQQLLAELGTLF